jgi:hypothetical protein
MLRTPGEARCQMLEARSQKCGLRAEEAGLLGTPGEVRGQRSEGRMQNAGPHGRKETD